MSADIAVTTVQPTVVDPPVPVKQVARHTDYKSAPQAERVRNMPPAQEQTEVVQKAKAAANRLNNVMDEFDKGLKFKVHEATHRTYVQVIDKKTDKVLHEFPPKKMLDTLARFHEVIGMIFDAQG